MELILYTVVGQLTFVGILFRWLQVQNRDIRLKVDSMYSKQETTDMIDLKQKPIEVGIEHVQKELAEVKHMIGRLLDEKNKG
jgi:hypothetical protein